MTILVKIAVLVATLNKSACLGFSAAPLASRGHSCSVVSLEASSRDRDEIVAQNNARTCVKSFLTQRAIQSFMYLLAECRDPHSGKWIEDFLDCQNLHNYHGTGAFNTTRFKTWESVLADMIEQPKDVMVVSAKRRGAGHGGWSKNNPYLPERFVEFPIDIDPASLAQRILSVRKQLSLEFIQDIDILISTNDQILDSYFDKVRNDRDNEGKESGGGINKKSESLASAFERATSYILSSNMESQVTLSSPFRKGNFDLLYNLCTQASVHKVLRDFQEAGQEDQIAFVWLRDFYSERVAEYFDGDQGFGRADDFIEEMLLTPPSLLDTGDGISGLMDPMGTAKTIITMRSEVAKEWKELLGETGAEHMQLQKLFLAKMMGAPFESKRIGEGEGFE